MLSFGRVVWPMSFLFLLTCSVSFLVFSYRIICLLCVFGGLWLARTVWEWQPLVFLNDRWTTCHYQHRLSIWGTSFSTSWNVHGLHGWFHQWGNHWKRCRKGRTRKGASSTERGFWVNREWNSTWWWWEMLLHRQSLLLTLKIME